MSVVYPIPLDADLKAMFNQSDVLGKCLACLVQLVRWQEPPATTTAVAAPPVAAVVATADSAVAK